MRRTEMRRGGPLPQFSTKRLAALDAAGIPPLSTFLPKPAVERPVRKAQRYTGPKRSVCDLVDARSGRLCEWPACPRPQDHRHHRLDRGMGGRHGEMADRLNGAAWLLAVCWVHHEIVTNPVGDLLTTVKEMGWVLIEGQDATAVPVWTRHSGEPVWLDNAGGWHQYEEGAA